MNTTYELKKDSDGKLWVSVNELMFDIKDALEKLSNLDSPQLLELSDIDKKQIDNKILGLHAIYTFLGALQTEQILIDKKLELERQPLMGDVNVKTVQFDVPIDVTKETLH